MEPQVLGAGFMFLGMGCGPALSAEQRAMLKDVSPESFYPLKSLLEMLDAAAGVDPGILYGNGRRWGTAMATEYAKAGVTDVMRALETTCETYQAHHKGDVGRLRLEADSDEAVYLVNEGPYPPDLIVGAFAAIALAMASEDIEVTPTDDPRRHRISWRGAR